MRALLRRCGGQALVGLAVLLAIDVVLGWFGVALLRGDLEGVSRTVFLAGTTLLLVDYLVFQTYFFGLQRDKNILDSPPDIIAYFLLGFTWKFLRELDPQKVRRETQALTRRVDILSGKPWLKQRIENEQGRGHVVCLAVINELYLPRSVRHQRTKRTAERQVERFERRQQSREERLERRKKRLEAKHAERAREAARESKERLKALLGQARQLGCTGAVKELLRAGESEEAKKFLDRAEILLRRAGELNVDGGVRLWLKLGALDSAEAAIKTAETEQKRENVISELLERASKLRDGRYKGFTPRIEALRELDFNSREWRKALYAIERDLTKDD